MAEPPKVRHNRMTTADLFYACHMPFILVQKSIMRWYTVAECSMMHSSLMQCIESLSDEDSSKAEFKSRLDEKLKVHFDYLGHLLRTKHQGEYYKFVQKNLNSGECVVVIDYKMKQGDSTRLV